MWLTCDEMAGQCFALHTNNTRKRYVNSGQGNCDQEILMECPAKLRFERSKGTQMVTMCQHYPHLQS